MVGDRLKEIRGEKSQKEFSCQLGVGLATLQRYEYGKKSPDGKFITQVCREYGVNPTWLLLGEGPKELKPYCIDGAVDMIKATMDNDPDARKRQNTRVKESGKLIRQSRDEAGEISSNLISALNLDESKAELLQQTLQTVILERAVAEQQRDKAWQTAPTTDPPIPDDNLGFGECADLLNKIFNSGNRVLIRAIAANLHAFSEAIDNKALAAKTVNMMEQMNNRMLALETKIKELEAVPKKAANG